jgi:hypothetical protein
MNPFTIQAASYLGPEGHGNDRTGLRPWSGPSAGALQRGDLETLHWSTLFASETSRFGRMDLLSRLGLMAVELLGDGFEHLGPAQRDSMGLCVESRSGSLATDWRFLQQPLASTFAYTLPSTVIGEICIRHRFRGPVMCLLPIPGQVGSLETALGWLTRGEAEGCLCVASDVADKEVARRLSLGEHALPAGWQGGAVWLGNSAGRDWQHPWQPGPLAALARTLCLEGAGK